MLLMDEGRFIDYAAAVQYCIRCYTRVTCYGYFFRQFSVVQMLPCLVHVPLRLSKGVFLMTAKNTMRLVIVALLLALEVILGTFFTINFAGIAKIGFGFLPIAMIAILYGPVWAGCAYAIGDVLAWFIKPEGAYFPGLSLTCFLVGIVMGLFLYKKEVTFSRCAICFLVIVFFLDFLLNTYWLHILMHQGFIALLPSRIIKCILTYAIEVLLVPIVWNKLMLRIPAVQEILDDSPAAK